MKPDGRSFGTDTPPVLQIQQDQSAENDGKADVLALAEFFTEKDRAAERDQQNGAHAVAGVDQRGRKLKH